MGDAAVTEGYNAPCTPGLGAGAPWPPCGACGGSKQLLDRPAAAADEHRVDATAQLKSRVVGRKDREGLRDQPRHDNKHSWRRELHTHIHKPGTRMAKDKKMAKERRYYSLDTIYAEGIEASTRNTSG